MNFEPNNLDSGCEREFTADNSPSASAHPHPATDDESQPVAETFAVRKDLPAAASSAVADYFDLAEEIVSHQSEPSTILDPQSSSFSGGATPGGSGSVHATPTPEIEPEENSGSVWNDAVCAH